MIFKEGDTCPFCKVGKIVRKEGRYGAFLGCDLYHHTRCSFIYKLTGENAKDPLEQEADRLLVQNNKEYLIL